MGSLERTTKEAYDKMKVHAPILGTILKFLPGRDAVKARLLDSFWKDIVPDLLQHEELTGASRLKPIDFTDHFEIECFLTEFPDGSPRGLAQFANMHFDPLGTPADTLRRFTAIHGPFLRFLTIDMHERMFGPPEWTFSKVILLLNNCPSIENLLFGVDHRIILPPEVIFLECDGIRPLPNLVALETRGVWYPGFMTSIFFPIINNAPKLCSISISIAMSRNGDENPQQTPFSSPIQNLVLAKLELAACSVPIFRDLPRTDVKVRELTITANEVAGAVAFEFEEEDIRTFSEWIGRQEMLQALSFTRRCIYVRGSGAVRTGPSFPFRFPPVVQIRRLKLDTSLFESPVVPSQVPNLEEVTLTLLRPGHNHFATGSIFPKMKLVNLSLSPAIIERPASWEVLLPNLESLRLTFGLGDIGVLGGHIGRFPTVLNLILNFDPRCSKKNGQGALWNFFTGGIRPVLRQSTGVEELLARTRAIAGEESEGSVQALPLEALPGLKTLELSNCPEIVAFAIVQLTAAGMIQHLDELRIELNRNASQNEVRNFIGVLKEYHRKVEISQSSVERRSM